MAWGTLGRQQQRPLDGHVVALDARARGRIAVLQRYRTHPPLSSPCVSIFAKEEKISAFLVLQQC
eukprot:1196346-Prorocentrum_minimum.AAC.10